MDSSTFSDDRQVQAQEPENRNCGRVAVGCLVVLVVVVSGAVYAVWSLSAYFREHPIISFGGSEEFENEPGTIAKAKLRESWPEGIVPTSVESISHRSESSRDSYSCWYRIVVGEEEAVLWSDAVHNRHARGMDDHSDHISPEGIVRTHEGAIPLHYQTGTTPVWWSPPSGTIRATEIMDWYIDSDSGYGTATYSHYDKSNGVLWIYEYVAQHHQLWPRGTPPNEGTLLQPAVTSEPHSDAERQDEPEP